jgi:DNA-binding GntR family transcriptional regulator
MDLVSRQERASILDQAIAEPTDRQTLGEAITDRLRELILDANLPPGMPLRPAQLAPRMGVSVMPVREALRILEAEGLVTFTARIGARVADLTETDVEEMYRVRAALEGLAARDAVEHVTPSMLVALGKAVGGMQRASETGDWKAFNEWDLEFHRRQFRAAGRPSLERKIADLAQGARRIRAVGPHAIEDMTLALEAHRMILEACTRKDAAVAEALTRGHTEDAGDRIQAALRVARTSQPAGEPPADVRSPRSGGASASDAAAP